MNKSVQENILIGVMFQSVAQKYFEYTIHELSGDKKALLNQMVNRLKVNRNDLYSTINTDEGRTRFLKEFELGDTLQFAEINLAVLKMDSKQRDLVEKVVNGILKHEIIEFVDESKY